MFNILNHQSLKVLLVVGVIQFLFPTSGSSQTTSIGKVDWKKVSLYNWGASPNSLHFAYAIDTMLFIDGKEVFRCKGICPASLQWTPDSKKVVIWAFSEQKWKLLACDPTNGSVKELKSFPCIIVQEISGRGTMHLRIPEGTILHFLQEGHAIRITGLPATPAVDRRVVLAPEAVHVGYAVRPDSLSDSWQVFLDDRPVGKQWDRVWFPHLTLSPDGKRLGFSGSSQGKWYVTIDSTVFGPWDNSGPISFSDNSKHWAFLAKSGEQIYMVVDGRKKQVGGEDIGRCLIAGWGEVLAWSVKEGDKWVLQSHLGKLTSGYDEIRDMILHPYGKYAFCARDGDGWLVVDLDTPGSTYYSVGTPVFSPKGSHLAYIAKIADDRFSIVVDGVAGGVYYRIYRNPFFESEDLLRYIVWESKDSEELKVIKEKLPRSNKSRE